MSANATKVRLSREPMIIAAISFPLGLLCLYLAGLGWKKNRGASAMLLLFAVLNLGLAFGITATVYYFSVQLELL